MKLTIAENIRAFRKERKFTQEQLAEALGVTVGAVSKWESGSSMPDISLIVEMADFFETSVDVLLGYEWRRGGMGLAVERIRELKNAKRFEEATSEAEKSLQKYPNAFDVVFYSAVMYITKGIECGSKKSFRRAQTLFERSLELIEQNTNEHISEWTIRNNIAEVHQLLGSVDMALELLKKNNADGLNNERIGFILAASEHKPEEALPYLSDALVSYSTGLLRLGIGFANAYCDRHDFDSALAVMDWIHAYIVSLERPDRVSYFNKTEVMLLSGSAQIAAEKGDYELARRKLAAAKAAAERFDAAPDFSFKGSRFFHGDEKQTAFDDFGGTALAGVKRALTDNEATAARLLAVWDELE